MSCRLPILVACLLLSAVSTRAALGETLADLRKRFGPPEPLQPHAAKNVSHWSIETEQSERLIYTVTFNAKGFSIAEGLKPVGRAVLAEALAQSFVDSQFALHRNATSTRTPKPGEKYRFAGQDFVCAPNEAVWVDETHDFMIVWAKDPKGKGLVMAVRAEMLAPAP
ncbi:hypothetical protein ESB00_18445 [Oleiharenicola lentus]|uniref:Uncharacterized protein n=1 Tax=Oleiharenicola lentus TaxID=2508720 RepID=A0A4Q1C5G2_9BACT|nr:hypothetical protein [Oleiharenicola lentus]RXK53668.1 hypothetical protein ESB00_18445 [Oleiharenicola lentus]